jgi:PAS domain S-box-containing protein
VIKKRKASPGPRAGLRKLGDRLQAAEDTLRAIRAGEVDALVVRKAKGERVVTLAGAELPYRIMFDQMYEGAVTLTRDGIIAYCNQRFADIVRTPLGRVIGSPLRRFVPPAEQPALEALRSRAGSASARSELSFKAGDGSPVPVSISLAPLRLDGSAAVIGVIGVVADISELKRAEELRARFTTQVLAAQDDERRRVARELHDETGQSLTGLLVGLRTIEGARTLAEAVERGQQLGEIVARTLLDVGRLARGLHPRVLDDLGFAAAVTGQVQEFAELHGIAVDARVKVPDADRLPPLLQTTLYRVLQEALTNVARHADARHVRVRLGREAATLTLCVQDDGIGMTPQAAPGPLRAGKHRGLGLESMRERVALLGGSVHVESEPGKGTTVAVRIPLQGALVTTCPESGC